MTATVLSGALSLGKTEAQVIKAPRYSSPVEAPTQQLSLPVPTAITPHGTVVEDIVVRVNDQIISRSDVERQVRQLGDAAAQGSVPKERIADEQKNMLRDMIDTQLLLSKAKTMGLNADADVIRQLDDIRKKNNMADLDELQRAATKEGVNWEDFKAGIRNNILTQMVVRDEVGRRLQLSQGDLKKYYDEHKDQFEQVEQVKLSEILIPTPESPSETQVAQAEAKAREVKAEVEKGGAFGDLAKKYSGGPSAAQGGELGLFKRGALAKVLEDQTFGLKGGESTQPIRTRQGFVILKVTQHIEAGPAPIEQVAPQLEEAMYMQQMQPALRVYLTKLREESYVEVQPGFVDSGASAAETRPLFTAYAAPVAKKKKSTQKARFDRSGSKAVVASPDTTGSRTLTGADAAVTTTTDKATGLAVIKAPAAPGKSPKRLRREKVRYGQAPRNSIQAAPETVTAKGSAPATAPGAVMASNGAETANLDDNALTPQAPVQKKTRFAATQKDLTARKATTVTAKQAEKAIAKPIPMSAEEKTATAVQSAPLGLSGDTTKKPKKEGRKKGQRKERLQSKPVDNKPAPVLTPEPTANPSLAPVAISPTAATPPASTPPVATPPQR